MVPGIATLLVGDDLGLPCTATPWTGSAPVRGRTSARRIRPRRRVWRRRRRRWIRSIVILPSRGYCSGCWPSRWTKAGGGEARSHQGYRLPQPRQLRKTGGAGHAASTRRRLLGTAGALTARRSAGGGGGFAGGREAGGKCLPSVGRPLAAMLLNRHATVTVCHSYTDSKPVFSPRTRRARYLAGGGGSPWVHWAGAGEAGCRGHRRGVPIRCLFVARGAHNRLAAGAQSRLLQRSGGGHAEDGGRCAL